MRARRSVVREFVRQERVTALCLVETKIDALSGPMATELLGAGFDYVSLPSVGASGGIVIAWCRDEWVATDPARRSHSVTVTIAPSSSPAERWTLSAVYGPVLEELKPGFLNELQDVRAHATGPVLICGDFNQIYRAADKNNARLHLRSMRRFQRLAARRSAATGAISTR
jgi:exonuclease III